MWFVLGIKLFIPIFSKKPHGFHHKITCHNYLDYTDKLLNDSMETSIPRETYKKNPKYIFIMGFLLGENGRNF